MIKIEVLGTGCAKCNSLEAAVKQVADSLGIDYELTHVKEISKIAAYGVLMTPALAINGVVKATGKLPTSEEIEEIIRNASSDKPQ